MKKPTKIFLAIILTTLLIFCGCWDTEDINKRAFVTAIGLDQVEPSKKNEKPDLNYKVTVEILNPSFLAKTVLGGNSEKKAGLIYTIYGKSIDDALENLHTRIPRHISLAELNVLIVGEEMARGNFENICDYFERNPEVARRIRLLLVQDGEARDVLNTKPLLERFVTEELLAMTETLENHALIRKRPFSKFLSDLRTNDGKAYGTKVLLSEENQIIYCGSAVFNENKLIGWLNTEETKNANWLTGEGKTVVEALVDRSKLTYKVDHKKVKIKPHTENGKLWFTVKLNTDGMILQERDQELDLSQPKNIKKVEQAFNKIIKEEIKAALKKSQKEFGVDYLGFGKILKNRYPGTFNKIDFDQEFPEIPIDVEVNAKITRFGMTK